MKRELKEANPEIPDDLTDAELDAWVDHYIQVQSEQPLSRTRGRGTTAESIDNEGMSSDDIENVLEKETHRQVPVIASDQIPSLTHFVGPKTKALSSTLKITLKGENTGEPSL